MAVKVKGASKVIGNARPVKGSDPLGFGVFLDRPGNNSYIKGGLGFDLPFGLGRVGVSLGDAAEVPGFGRWGLGASLEKSGRQMGPRGQRKQQGEDLGDPMTFWDYLALAQQLGGGSRVDYTPLMDRARQNQAEGDARLAALFSRLQGEIAADRPGIEQTFGDATTSVGQAGEDTRSLINAAYESAAQQRAQQLAALGIEEAALRDEFTAGDQAAALARSAERQNISQNQLSENQATALNYNTQIGQSVGQQGAEYRAALERALFDRLAELEVAQSEANARYGDNVLDRAFQFAQNPLLFDPVARQQAAAQQEFENQMAANRFALDQYKAMGSQRTLEEILGTHNQITALAQQLGIGNDPESLANFIEYLKSIGWAP